MPKLFMFVPNKTRLPKMNHSAKNRASCTSHTLGCNDLIMSVMPMIMRQPSIGVIIHID